MIVLTGLFFNKKGNQSFYNSIKNYASEYNTTIITAAALDSDTYLSPNEAKKEFEKLKIISVTPNLFSRARRLLSRIQANKEKNNHKNYDNEPRELLNTKASSITYYAFIFRSLFLAGYAFAALLKNRNTIICAYEINGLHALSLIKWIFPNKFSFGKFQGTVLGFDINIINKKEIQDKYKLDYTAAKKIKCLDAAIMTNDGTNGLNVLLNFGLKNENVLFIQNGIDERFLREEILAQPQEAEVTRRIKTISVSRLTKWKRVDVIIKSFSILVHEYGRKEFLHTVVGVGSPSEELEIRNLIHELNLDQNINYHGSATTEEVKKLMLKSDCLISMYKYSNVANPVFEGLALCLPVVTIYQHDLELAIGKLTSGCFFVEDNTNDLTLARNLADQINSITSDKIEGHKNIIRTHRDTLLTWSERGSRELNFIEQAINRTNNFK